MANTTLDGCYHPFSHAVCPRILSGYRGEGDTHALAVAYNFALELTTPVYTQSRWYPVTANNVLVYECRHVIRVQVGQDTVLGPFGEYVSCDHHRGAAVWRCRTQPYETVEDVVAVRGGPLLGRIQVPRPIPFRSLDLGSQTSIRGRNAVARHTLPEVAAAHQLQQAAAIGVAARCMRFPDDGQPGPNRWHLNPRVFLSP